MRPFIFYSRLKTIITRCIHIWQTSLVRAYTGYLHEAKTVLTHYRQQHMEEKEGSIYIATHCSVLQSQQLERDMLVHIARPLMTSL